MTSLRTNLVDIKAAIINGDITRERACDGKSRFNRADKAQRSIDKWALRDPDRTLVYYACPFCLGFHLATQRYK